MIQAAVDTSRHSKKKRSSSVPRYRQCSDYTRKLHRRSSHDEITLPEINYLVNVEEVLEALLAREDTNKDYKITILDEGSKVICLDTTSSDGYQQREIRGTYQLSNLLQQLSLAQKQKSSRVVIAEWQLNESPVHRLSRFIKDSFWDNLIRCLDGTTVSRAAYDPKDWILGAMPRIYIPKTLPEQYDYYSGIVKTHPELSLDVAWLPEGEITPQTIKDLSTKPGILALQMKKEPENADPSKRLAGMPFIVPGGRYNELYGWDSYFCSLGLLISGKTDLVVSIVQNFIFEIQNYGKILNANRSYYLCRSQPPLFTDLVLRTFKSIKAEPGSQEFLRNGILAAIKEYNNVWVAEPRLDKISGLSRYRPDGHGIPMETEPGHYKHILEPYAKKRGMTYDEFVTAYNNEEIHEPALDEFFLHDRAVRESGHDTSARLENVAGNLATIDLNCLLYRYETDIASTISDMFGNNILVTKEFCMVNQTEHHESSELWWERAARRKKSIDAYLWNEDKGMYFDYDTVRKQQTDFETATSLWALWSGVASPHQATKLVQNGLPLFECYGGLSSTSKSSAAKKTTPFQRQWDYPNAWAPHQMMAWDGLQRYGFEHQAQRLIYRWLFTVIKVFVDFNGTVVEKYNVTDKKQPHKVEAEYGNQGFNFKYIPSEGFGWTNASFVYGLSLLNAPMKKALELCAPYESLSQNP